MIPRLRLSGGAVRARYAGLAAVLLATIACTAAHAGAWGSSNTPFAVDSPWNSRPVNPRFGDARVPPARYPPAVLSNGWSTGVFVARPDDRPVTVRGISGSPGLWHPDEHVHRDLSLPRWPRDVDPASESDGHADIVDPVQGVIHSFWQLRREKGEWVAAQYAWSSLGGRGWGDPAHYFQGARATGVPAMAGLIRRHEVHDGAPLYRHALALSLADNALAPDPTYVFPATSADTDAARRNTGRIPQGTLLMLPPGFDTATLSDLRVRKIAETLKVYGAYVVDRNDGTPFVIYAEIGSDLDLHRKLWNRAAVADLERIREALRPVVDAETWVDGDGRRFKPEQRLNLISLRGPWKLLEGGQAGRFDSRSQSLVFSVAPERVRQQAELPEGLSPVFWARPEPGKRYCLRSVSSGGAVLRMVLADAGQGTVLVDSGKLGHGQEYRFAWPDRPVRAMLQAESDGRAPASVRAVLQACGDAQDASGK